MSTPEGGAFNLENILQRVFKNTYRALQVVPKYTEYTVHPWGRGNLTTSGVQYTSVSSGSTLAGSSATYFGIDPSATINPANADDIDDLDELEMAITFRAMKVSTAAVGSSLGYKLQGKNSSNSTWTDLSSTKQYLMTTAWVERTLSGYADVSGNVNVIPFNLRLAAINKTLGDAKLRIKNSSYVKIKGKKS